MFSKLKQFKELKNQAKHLRQQLSDEQICIDRNGIKVTISANLRITELTIDRSLGVSDIERLLPEIINEAQKKAQQIMVEKFKSGDLKITDLKI